MATTNLEANLPQKYVGPCSYKKSSLFDKITEPFFGSSQKKVLVSNINEVKKDNIDNEVDEVKVDEVKVDEVKNSKKITKKK